MQTTTLVRIVRDPRSGEVHVPNERVAILAITQNLNRTLLKVRWEAGGECVIFPDDVDENPASSLVHAIVTRVLTQQN